MAEEIGKLNLNKRDLGMSSDKYAWGSFLYGQNIKISDNSKSFSISDNLLYTVVNSRSGNTIAMVWPYSTDKLISFSDDGYIESDSTFNENNSSMVIWWPLYKRSTGWYLNALKIGDYTVGLSADKLDLFTGDLHNSSTGIIPFTSIVTTPDLIANTGWTVNAWWTTWVWGAVHSSGTGSLYQDLTVNNAKKYRVSVQIYGHTTGNVTVSMWWVQLWIITPTTTRTWNMWVRTTASTSEQIYFTPTTTFNWTIGYVNINEYVAARTEEWKATITSATTHPMLFSGWDLYIGSGKSIDIVSISDRVPVTKNIIDSRHSIVSIQEIGQSIVIFSTDNEDSKISYWDWVSDEPDEVITWKDKVITNVVVDWIFQYILCESTTKKELYLASGYDKKLIAVGKSWFLWQFGYNYDVYRTTQRNNFYNNPLWTNAMWFSGNKLLIPAYQGIYTYGFENPNSVQALVKERTIDCDYSVSVTANIWWIMYIAYKTHAWANRISLVRTYQNQTSSDSYLITNPLLWDNFSTQKSIEKFGIGYILPRSTASIDIYLSANDYYYRTFEVSWVTTSPTAGAIYSTSEYSSPYNLYEVISTDITGWVGYIYCKTINLIGIDFQYSTVLTKSSWIGDASISSSDSDNFIKIKTITATQYTQWREILLSEFVQAHMVDWHQIQFKIKLNALTSSVWSPEVFDIPISSTKVWQNV